MLINKIRKHNKKSKSYILAWIGFAITTLTMVFSLFWKYLHPINEGGKYVGVLVILWFDFLQQFTQQTNLLLIIFYFLFIFFFRTKIFNSNKFLIFTAAYIFLVFVVAWFILTPVYIFNSISKADIFDTISTMLVHLVTPIFFVVFACNTMTYLGANKRLGIKYFKYCSISFIYPLIYFTYLIVINFIPLPTHFFKFADRLPEGHNFISVYSILTNYNPKCLCIVWENNDWTYTPTTVDNSGSYYRILIVPMVLVFYNVEFLFFSYINNRLNGCYDLKRK